jgi:hypothetical protein
MLQVASYYFVMSDCVDFVGALNIICCKTMLVQYFCALNFERG